CICCNGRSNMRSAGNGREGGTVTTQTSKNSTRTSQGFLIADLHVGIENSNLTRAYHADNRFWSKHSRVRKNHADSGTDAVYAHCEFPLRRHLAASGVFHSEQTFVSQRRGPNCVADSGTQGTDSRSGLWTRYVHPQDSSAFSILERDRF